jgi:hypothetical protein
LRRILKRVPVSRRLVTLLVMVALIGLCLYPDPRPLLSSLVRLGRPPIDAAAAAGLARGLPDDPVAIEAFVDGYVPYETAWALYGLPWYFPTVTQVVADHGGDCQARAILTASILRAKGLPYTFRYSFDHVWVDWPGKKVTALEDSATAFVSDAGKGWWASLPHKIPLRDIVEVRLWYHWDPMPASRKWLMLAGVLLALFYGENLLTPMFRAVAWAVWRRGRRPAPKSEPSAPV